MFSGGAEVKNIMPAICDTDKFKAGAEQDQCKALVEVCAAKADENTCNTGNISDNRADIRDTLTDGDAASREARKNYDTLMAKLTGLANNSAAEPAAEEAPAPAKKKKAAKKEEVVEEEAEGEAEEEKTTPVATHPFFKEKNFVAIVSGVYSPATRASGATDGSGSNAQPFNRQNCTRNRFACGGDGSGASDAPNEWSSTGFQVELLYPVIFDEMQLHLGGLSGYRSFYAEDSRAATFQTIPLLLEAKAVYPVGRLGIGLALLGGYQFYFMDKDTSKSISNGDYTVKGEDLDDFRVLTFGGKFDLTFAFSEYIGANLGVQMINGVDDFASKKLARDARGKEYSIVPADGRVEILVGLEGAL